MADPAAVTERVSGKPGGGPMLQGENLKEFASAIAGQGDESTPAPSEAGAPAEPTTEEPAQEAPAPDPSSETPAAPKPAAPRAPAPAPEEKGPIPYDRFREVNQQLQAERAKILDIEKNQSQRIQEAATAQSAQTLFKIAEEHPELAPLIFRGEKPAPRQAAPADPNAPQLTPEQKEIAQIRENNTALMAWKQKTEQAAVLQTIQDRAEGQMEKHPIFKNDVVRSISEEIIVKRILTQPHISPEVIVDQVAKGFTDLESSIKAQYLERKTNAARTVAPGVGSGSPPAPPANTPKKLKLSDGSALKALHSAMAGMQQS